MSAYTIHRRGGRARITRLALAAAALGVMTTGVSAASTQEAPQVARTPWQMHIDPAPSGPLSTGQQLSSHGEVAAYVDAQVPAGTADSWQSAPDGDIIGFDGRVSGFGGDTASRLRGFPCLTAVDYTYFQTFVTVPTGGTVSDFRVSFNGVDDGARISIYNPEHAAGLVVPGSYVALNGSGTTDLAAYMGEGVNRVVITQLDDCAVGNNLREARIVLNGVVIPPAPLDTTPPVVVAELNPAVPDGDNGWYRGEPTVSFTASDPESELTSTTGCEDVTISVDTAGRQLDCTATSAGGSAAAVVTIKRDGTAPLIDRADVVDGTWRNRPRSERFSASDEMSGLADSDDASFTLTASDESAAALTPTVVEKAIVDQAGNTSTRRVTALIDMSSPVVGDAGTTATPNAAGWHRRTITNTFTASDALSGLAAGSSASRDVSTADLEGNAVTVSSGAVSDAAGNKARSTLSEAFKIDLTPPTVALIGAADGASIWRPQAEPRCAGDDTLSGVASCIVTGSTSPEGTRTFTATATDNAGNTAVVSRTDTETPPAADAEPLAEQSLPVTGIATGLIALWALVALAAGGVLLLSARRIRPC